MMRKTLCALAAVSAVLFIGVAYAADMSPDYDRCMDRAKTFNDRLACVQEAEIYLGKQAEDTCEALKKSCSETENARECMAAAEKAHNAYIDYYDKMAVVLGYMSNAEGNESRISAMEQLSTITSFHTELMQGAIENLEEAAEARKNAEED